MRDTAMQRATEETGNASYMKFVNANFDYFLNGANGYIDTKGLFWWGWHRHVDVHTDTLKSESGSSTSSAQHEMHFVDVPMWNEMYARNAASVGGEMQGIWDWNVVNHTTGEINRHSNATPALNFITSAAVNAT